MKNATITIASLMVLLNGAARAIRTARPRRKEQTIEDKPEKNEERTYLRGAAQHCRSEIARMTNEVAASYAQTARHLDVDGLPKGVYGLQEQPKAMRDMDEDELVTSLLLTNPKTIVANLFKVTRPNKDAGATMLGPDNDSVSYNSDRRQGNVLSW